MGIIDGLLSHLPRLGAPRPGSEQHAEGGRNALLERLLTTLEAQVISLALCEVASGQALMLPGLKEPIIHYVLKGAGILRVEENGDVPLEPHCFVVVPARRTHNLQTRGAATQIAALESTTAMVDHIVRISSDEGQAPELVTTCGSISATYRGSIGIFDALNRAVSVKLQEGDPLRQAFEAMLGEFASPKLGTRALSEALLKQCLVHLIRKLAPDPVEAGWLFGITDTRLARAVLAMVESPAQHFTLKSLARNSGMSRASFADHFQAAFGTTPIDLLKRIRLRHAARLLETTDLPIAAIARSIGYESRTYFSRAFRAEFGTYPKDFRQHSRTPAR